MIVLFRIVVVRICFRGASRNDGRFILKKISSVDTCERDKSNTRNLKQATFLSHGQKLEVYILTLVCVISSLAVAVRDSKTSRAKLPIIPSAFRLRAAFGVGIHTSQSRPCPCLKHQKLAKGYRARKRRTTCYT